MADETIPEAAAAPEAPEAPVEASTPVEAAQDPTPTPSTPAGPTPTTSPESPAPTAGSPVVIDQLSKRSDADPLQGSFVKVVDGEHAGQVAAFLKPVEVDADGYPATILVRFRDPSHTHEYAVVDLGQVVQSSQTGIVS